MVTVFQKCQRPLGVICGALLLIGAASAWLLSLGEEQPPEFQLEMVRQLKLGITNVVVFRVTALDKKETLLAAPGYISVPTAQVYPGFGHWTVRSVPAATCITNFIPVRFKSQTQFAIIAPTNQIWRLAVRPLRVLSRTQVWKWKAQMVWEDLKKEKPAAMRRAWSLPWAFSINHFAWSNSFTNRVSTD